MQIAALGVAACQVLELLPLGVVEPDVVLGVAEEVEPRVLDRVAEEALGRTLPLRQAGVHVRLAPEDSASRRRFHPDRVRAGRERAVGGDDLEPEGARLIEAKTLDAGRRRSAGRDARQCAIARPDLPGGRRRRGAVPGTVFGPHEEVERLSCSDHRWRERHDSRGLRLPDHLQRRPSRAQQIALAVEVEVDRQQELVGRERGRAPAARALRLVAVGHGDGVAGVERLALQLERDGRSVAAERAVHAEQHHLGRLEPRRRDRRSGWRRNARPWGPRAGIAPDRWRAASRSRSCRPAEAAASPPSTPALASPSFRFRAARSKRSAARPARRARARCARAPGCGGRCVRSSMSSGALPVASATRALATSRGQVDRQLLASERERVAPVPQRRDPIQVVRCVGWRRARRLLQALDAPA